MKSIKINWIHYENFKNIKDFKLELAGNSVNIFAQNKIGKTSLYDGFLWLLFGKNSDGQNDSGKSSFRAKPFDKDGNDILGKEPKVTAELDVDGETIKLTRELREVWSNDKKSIDKTRKADKTCYYIDDVPIKTKKEFDTKVSGICDEDVFKLITNPAEFANKSWQDRREILLSMADEVTDDDVFDGNKELEKLQGIIGDKDPNDYKKIIDAKLKATKDDINRLGIRYDEASHATYDNVNQSDGDFIPGLIEKNNFNIDGFKDEIASLKNGSVVSEIKKQIADLNVKVTEARANYNSDVANEIEAKRAEIGDLSTAKRTIDNQLYQDNLTLERNERALKEHVSEKEELLRQYHEHKERVFDPTASVCPFCGQDMPAEQIEDKQAKFNQEKSETLERILKNGKEIAEKITQLNAKDAKLKEKIVDLRKQSEPLESQIEALKAEIVALQAQNEPFEKSKAYTDYVAKKQKLTDQLQDLDSTTETKVAEIKAKIGELLKRNESLNEKLSLIKLAKQQEERLEEIKQKDKDLKTLYNDLQAQAYLVSEFKRTKLRMVEERVNELFSLVQFKLFELQKNGLEAEICSITVDGSDYFTNLNNGHKIKAGLDIIKTLSKHYEVSAPAFVDNAESVSETLTSDNQLINLYVSDDPQFRIEK